MKIIINNTEDAEMPEEMITHCEKLLECQIEEMPIFGNRIEVLYSEKDPLRETDKVDDSAYFIYFEATKIEPKDETNLENLTIYVDIIF